MFQVTFNLLSRTIPRFSRPWDCMRHANTFWIWVEGPGSKEAARFRRHFEVTQPLRAGILFLTCDNGARVLLDGQPVLTNADWNLPAKADLTLKLSPDKHELMAECKNEGAVAGLVARLILKPREGMETVVATDASWEATVPSRTEWKPAKMVGDTHLGGHERSKFYDPKPPLPIAEDRSLQPASELTAPPRDPAPGSHQGETDRSAFWATVSRTWRAASYFFSTS